MSRVMVALVLATLFGLDAIFTPALLIHLCR
jgi:hypothetical protein